MVRNARKKEARYLPVDPITTFENGVPQPEPFAENMRAYEAHTWVYACVSAIATNFAGICYEGYRQSKDGTWKEYDNHPLLPLLEEPNPYMSGYNLREVTAMSLELTGNAYWALERLGGSEIKEIWPLPADSVRIKSSKSRLVDSYLLDVGGQVIPYAPEEIIHFRSANPSSMLYGQGAVTAAKLAITQDFYAQTWNKVFFQNSGRPDAVLESEKPLDQATRQRVREAWNQMNQGASRRGKTALLEGGLKYKEVNRTHAEMDFVELRKMSREEILAAFGVPPVVVGIFEYANYANTKEQIQIFWKQCLIPRIRAFESTLNLRAAQLFYDPATNFQADLSHVEALRVDENQRATTAKVYVDIGVPLNAVIDKLDLPFDPVEGGDVSRPVQSQQPAAMPPAKSIATKSLPILGEDELRTIEWKRFDQTLRDLEEPFQASMRGFFKSQKDRVVKRLKARARVIIDQAQHQATKSFRDEMGGLMPESEDQFFISASAKHIRRAFEGLAQRTAQKLGDVDFNMNDPLAEAWLDSKVLRLVQMANKFTLEQISDGVLEAVREAVNSGFDEGETIQQIVYRIDEVFQFAVDTRAERIARTEVISASNAGSLQAMQQLGAEQKEWLSSRDEKVRDTHRALDGQVVGVAEDFISDSGTHLAFPGDPGADPSEIINCRCNVRPYVSKDQ